MKSTFIKIVSATLSLFVLFYIGVQVYKSITSPYKTETVFESVIADSIETQAVAFRNEEVIDSKKPTDGIISYYYPNGSKVAKNSSIGVVYEDAKDLEKNYKIEQLTQEIEVLQECGNQKSLVNTQSDMLIKQLKSDQLSLIDRINNYNLEEVSTSKFEILKNINRVQIITGKIKNVSERIKTLKAERQKLKDSISSNNKAVYASTSGFFVDETDGFEDEKGFNKALNQTANSLSELMKKAEAPRDTIGKIITSYEWRFVICVDKNKAMNFTEGKNITANFASFADENVVANIEQVNEPDANGNVIIVMKSDLMDEDIATLRKDRVKISFNNNKGLKVSKKALYVNNGVKGVYCLLGNEVIFKKVDIVFETDDYFLSAQHTDDADYLKIYDDVIIKGKDLYDKQKTTK